MTVNSDIIKAAFREANLIPINQSPTVDEQNEAILLLNRFYKSNLGNEAGDKYQSVIVGVNNVVTAGNLPIKVYTGVNFAPLNVRLICNLAAATSINLHPDPEDGSRIAIVDASNNLSTYPLTLVGNGRTIGGANTAVLNTAGLKTEYFYRSDLADWTAISDMTLNGTFPFPVDFEDLFIIGLATRLNPRNGVALDDQAMMNFKRQRSLFKARYSQSIQQESEEGLVRLSGTRLNRVYNPPNGG